MSQQCEDVMCVCEGGAAERRATGEDTIAKEDFVWRNSERQRMKC